MKKIGDSRKQTSRLRACAPWLLVLAALMPIASPHEARAQAVTPRDKPIPPISTTPPVVISPGRSIPSISTGPVVISPGTSIPSISTGPVVISPGTSIPSISTGPVVISPGPSSSCATSPAVTNLDSWRQYMAQHPAPNPGCFKAAYPCTGWTQTQCVQAPQRPLQAGGGTDWVAQAQGGNFVSATGSFQSVTGLTSEFDNGTHGENDFSLQINANKFSTAVANTANCSKSSPCIGWQQFALENCSSCSGTDGGSIFIQYHLNPPCPVSQVGGGNGTGPPGSELQGGGTVWTQAGSDCFINSAAIAFPALNISDISQISLSATVGNNGLDSVMLASGPDQIFLVSTPTGFVGLNQQSSSQPCSNPQFPGPPGEWCQAEFNVFGLVGGSQAQFNAGTTITVTNALNLAFGPPISASCPPPPKGMGTTGETNNLNLGSTCSVSVLPVSNRNQISFTESLASGTATNQITATLNGNGAGGPATGLTFDVGPGSKSLCQNPISTEGPPGTYSLPLPLRRG